MNTKFRSAVAATGLAGSMLLAGVGIATAQTATTTPSTAASTVSSAVTSAATAQADATTRINTALAPLVKAGTITQAQADAVAKQLATTGLGGPGGGGGGGMRGLGNHEAVVAAALGMSTTDLQTALQSGKTIAQIAADKGVTVQKVIDAWVADEQQEHPEMTAADITARITAAVNRTLQGGRTGGARGVTGSVTTSGSTTATAAA